MRNITQIAEISSKSTDSIFRAVALRCHYLYSSNFLSFVCLIGRHIRFTYRSSIFGNIPLTRNYHLALALLGKIDRLSSEHRPIRRDLYELLLHFKDVWDSRTLNALPNTLAEAEQAIQANDIGTVHQPKATRSVQWLYENGKCIDHIVPGISTIPDAGHGAFAKRDLPEGTVITGSPLHHTTSRTFFEMHGYDYDEYQRTYRTKKVVGLQLLINYCFSHPLTTMHLCPYGAGVNYINHNKTMANVKVQWAEHGRTSHNATLLEMIPQSISYIHKASLALDYIATRDIKQGEELFLDYGYEWENAWRNHIEGWNQSEQADDWGDYQSAFQYNKEHANDFIRTDKEREIESYPANLQIRCHAGLWYERQTTTQYEELVWEGDDTGYPCQIITRNDDDNTYDLLVIALDEKQVFHRNGVPRNAIVFADVPYSTDMHLQDAFRQPLTLPDSLLPSAWMNVELN